MPTEVPHTPTKLFYKQELFLSTVDGTHPIVAIVGKCAVLDYGEYICSKYRCTISVKSQMSQKFMHSKIASRINYKILNIYW